MLNTDELLEFLRNHRQTLKSDFRIVKLGLIGSFARGEKYNDVDLLIEEKMNYEKRNELKTFLEKSLHVPVDIVIKEFAEPIILHRAMKEIKYATGH